MNTQTSIDTSAALQQLTELQEELSNRLESLSTDRSKSHSIDSSEQAVERENDEVIDQLESDARKELEQVKLAIQRLDNGTYGVCVKCEEEISPARLKALPFVELCINCADGYALNAPAQRLD